MTNLGGIRSDAVMAFDCIVVASHLRYDGVFQRPQQIVGRLARRVPVLYVEEPFLAQADDDDLRDAGGGVTVLRPKRRNVPDAGPDVRTLQAIAAWSAARRPLVWLYTPMMLPVADALPAAPLVFDCMDELSAFAFAPPNLLEREAALLRRARYVFTGGRSLYERRRSLGEKVRLYPSGVEFERFAAARTCEPHALLPPLARPILGYAGVLDERIDLDCLVAVADRPCSLVLVGPVVKIDPGVLPRRTNVHLTGQMPYATLPSLLAGFDVALMPFARNAATQNISPTKTPEYLAAGLPVVSTAIPDVIATYGDVVTIADDPLAFARAALDAVRPDPARIAAGTVRAREAGWDALVDRMWAELGRE
ncbi:MAG: glycosyltransferase family 1 protein [Vulcanimicrobiaceae bacterium]